jgi:DNA-directed RNA polymerase subunit beta'
MQVLLKKTAAQKWELESVDVVEGGEVIVSISERVLGRFAQEDIKHPVTEELIVAKGSYIEEQAADLIEESGIQNVYIRSALTCEY